MNDNASTLDLAELMERLQRAQLEPDTRQYLAAHRLLLELARKGYLVEDNTATLISHLSPVFCRSPEHQQLFAEEVRAWRRPLSAKDTQSSANALALPRAQTTPWSWTVNWVEWAKWLRHYLVKGDSNPLTAGRRPILIAIVLVALALPGAASWYFKDKPAAAVSGGHSSSQSAPHPKIPAPEAHTANAAQKSPPSASNVTVASQAGNANDASYQFSLRWWLVGTGVLVAASLSYFILWVLNRRRRQLAVKRMSSAARADEVPLNPDVRLGTDIPPHALRSISVGLRRARAQPILEFSPLASVTTTVQAGGLASLAFLPRLSTPEYLVLIDRRGPDDHAAHLVQRQLEQLRAQGVRLDIYEFNADPRVCNVYGSLGRHRLTAVLARHHRATLLLCAESEVCVDAMTGRPCSWVDSLSALSNRALLTLTPAQRWGESERLLQASGFILLPASLEGLKVLGGMGSTWIQPALAGRYTRDFPRILVQSGHRWLDLSPPPEDLMRRLLRELHAFLGPHGYTWLSACAIYPQIAWPITLGILGPLLQEDQLDARQAIDEVLPALARLPWFRYGRMPDWLRRILIASLTAQREATYRAMIGEWVLAALGVPRSSRDIRRADVMRLLEAAPVGSPLRDAVFVGFMAGASPEPLALRLPPGRHPGAPRRRHAGERIRRWWHTLELRRPLVARVATSLLVALVAGVGLLPAAVIGPRELGTQWRSLGQREARGGNFAGAQLSLEQAMSLGRATGDLATVAAAAQNLGMLHSAGLAFLAADARGAALIRNGEQKAAPTASEVREYGRAKTYLEQALALDTKLGRDADVARDDSLLGGVYQNFQDVQQARELHNKALALNTRLGRRQQAAQNYRDLAGTYDDNLEQSEGMLKKALALDQGLGLKESMAEDYRSLAAIARRRNQPKDVETLYKQALALTPRLEQWYLLSELQHFYENQNQQPQAAEIKKQHDAISKERLDAGYADVLYYDNDLGLWLSGAWGGDHYTELEQVIPLERAMGSRIGLATTYTLLGMHYSFLAENDVGARARLDPRAEEMLKRAQDIDKSLQRDAALANVDNQLVTVLDRRGEAVEPTLSDALALYGKLKDRASAARLVWTLGYNSHQRGDNAQACAYWGKGATLYPEDRSSPNSQSLYKCKGP